MKKTFLVEIIYDELDENIIDNSDVLCDTGIEVCIGNLLYDYSETKSIKEKYFVGVEQIPNNNE